jgi:L-lactate dehydrogenase (cytochrome)
MSVADIVAANALGVDNALIGRPYLYGLMAGGQSGVEPAVEILTGEIGRTLKLLGVRSIRGTEPGHVTLPMRAHSAE